MAVTANGTPYVETSDLVANYPGVSLALANHIDDTAGILQVVRATDTTARSTTSTSFVDVTGMSVTITPQQSTSSIIVLCNFLARTTNQSVFYDITDSGNTSIIGGTSQNQFYSNGLTYSPMTPLGYDSPSTTSATTYKLRFRAEGSTTAYVEGAKQTSQMYAIEVSA